MSIQHFYSQTVADGTATSVVRPSDWNSVHNQVLNMGGNTAGTSQISGADIVWAGGNNITLSANGSTVTIVGPTTVAQTVQTQASGNIVGQGFTSTTTAGTAVVATQNSNGLSMGVPAYLTTAASSNHSHNFATTTTNGSNIVVGTANSAGATIGVPNFLTTAAATNVTSGRAGTGTTLGFIGGLTGSVTLDTNGINLQLSELAGTDTWYATGANTIAGTNTSGTFSTDGYVVSGAGILSAGVSGNTLILSVPAGGGAGDGGNTLAVAGSTAGSNSLVLFSNSPTVTFGMAGNTITASAAGGGGGGVTIGKWEPFYPAGSTTSIPGNNSCYFQRLQPEQNVSFSYIERRMSNNASSTNVAATGGHTIDYGLYKRGAGASSTQMELIGSSQIVMAVSMSSSTASWAIGQGGVTNTWSSTTTTPSSLFTGLKHLYMPFTSTMSAGQEYWVGMRVSSSGSSQCLRLGFWEQTVINNLTVGKIYGTTASASNSTYVGDFNQGVYSTTSANLPGTVQFNQISNAVSQARMYLQFDDGV